MPRPNDLSRSLVALHQDSTLIAVIELSQSSWLVAGIVPGLERQPLKKLEPDQEALLRLLRRWQDEATKAGKAITRIAVAFEAGRDGFWLARWLRARGVEAHVIHSTSIAVSREHRRAKTDRLDTELLKRAGRWRSRQCLEPSAGCGASGATAAWPRSRPSRRRTPGAPTASGRAWWASAPGS
jgi:transposase